MAISSAVPTSASIRGPECGFPGRGGNRFNPSPITLFLGTLAHKNRAAAIAEISEDTTGGNSDGERKLVLRTRFRLNLDTLMRHLGQTLKTSDSRGRPWIYPPA